MIRPPAVNAIDSTSSGWPARAVSRTGRCGALTSHSLMTRSSPPVAIVRPVKAKALTFIAVLVAKGAENPLIRLLRAATVGARR